MNLTRFEIHQDLCRQCGSCEAACPHHAIAKTPDRIFLIDQDACTRCGTCLGACKLRAIVKKRGLFH